MKIAIIGTGIAGLTCAHRLHREHDLTLFESSDWVGGHTHTVEVERGGRTWEIDTGFIVFNDWTYPNFIRLLDELGVDSQPTEMSFSVRCERSGLEYNGTSLNTLFAQRSNLFRPSFHRMIRDILRFNREAPAMATDGEDTLTLGDYLTANGYSDHFREHYVIPMGAAIWSAPADAMLRFPVRFFIRFFKNHGMLSVSDRPRWRVVQGGSRRYVDALIKPFGHRIRLRTPVAGIRRSEDHVQVIPVNGEAEEFDHVIVATHSDQALRLLADPTPSERAILGALPYQENDVVLHTDASLMPRRRLAWAAWNYHLPRHARERVAVTYNMNILQSLTADEEYLVSLNCRDRIDPATILGSYTYHHPLMTAAGVAAQARHGEISGRERTHYCGAYWRNGFHEDGVVSALEVCRGLAYNQESVIA